VQSDLVAWCILMSRLVFDFGSCLNTLEMKDDHQTSINMFKD